VIRIERIAEPAVLARLGAVWTAIHEGEFAEDPDGYLDGSNKLAIKEHVYGHDDVRAALRAMQHSKCCYCEVGLDNYMARHVEHWRPKGAVRQDNDSPEVKPGYYWLAYQWDNLFLACTLCNSVNKGVRFPLRNPAERARSHLDSVLRERPLLLRPDTDDPADHIEWRRDQPRGRSDAGWATIEVIGLIRDDDPRRTAAFKALEIGHARIWKMHARPEFEDDARAILDELRQALSADSPFCAMSRAYLATLSFPPGFEP